jgi:hypothetical protein
MRLGSNTRILQENQQFSQGFLCNGTLGMFGDMGSTAEPWQFEVRKIMKISVMTIDSSIENRTEGLHNTQLE